MIRKTLAGTGTLGLLFFLCLPLGRTGETWILKFQTSQEFSPWRGEGIEAGGPVADGLQVRGGEEFRLYSPSGLGIPVADRPYLRIRFRPYSPRYLRVFWFDRAGRPVPVPRVVQPPLDRKHHTFWIPLARGEEHRGEVETLGLIFGGQPGWVEIETVQIRPFSTGLYLRDQWEKLLSPRPLTPGTINSLSSPRVFSHNLAYFLNLAAAMVILVAAVWFFRSRPARRGAVIGSAAGCLLFLWIVSDLRETLEQFRQAVEIRNNFILPPEGEKTFPGLGDFYCFADYCREHIPPESVFALVHYPNWPIDVRLRNLLYPSLMADPSSNEYLAGRYPRYVIVFRQPQYKYDPDVSRIIYQPDNRPVSGPGTLTARYDASSFIFREEAP